MLAKIYDALSKLFTDVPYGSFNMGGLKERGIIVETKSRNPALDTNYFLLPPHARKGLSDHYRDNHHFFQKDSDTFFEDHYKHIDINLKNIISYGWVYAFIVKMKTADCISLSKALAWILLIDASNDTVIDQLEIVGLTLRSSETVVHAFIVINRPSETDINNPVTWGNQTVIVDPWHKTYFTADKWSTFKEILPVSINNPDCYGYGPTYHLSYFNSLSLPLNWRIERLSYPRPVALQKFDKLYDRRIVETQQLRYLACPTVKETWFPWG